MLVILAVFQKALAASLPGAANALQLGGSLWHWGCGGAVTPDGVRDGCQVGAARGVGFLGIFRGF